MVGGKKKQKSNRVNTVMLKNIVKRPLGDGDFFFDISSRTVEIPVSFTQVYDGFFEVLLTLDALEIYILFYIMMRVDGEGDHTFNRSSKEKFMTIVARQKGRAYSIGGINNATKTLVDKGILKRSARSVYRVNPLFISRNINHEDRLELIAANHNREIEEEHQRNTFNLSYNKIVKNWEKVHGLMTEEELKRHGGVRNEDGSYTFAQDPYIPLKGVNRGKYNGRKAAGQSK